MLPNYVAVLQALVRTGKWCTRSPHENHMESTLPTIAWKRRLREEQVRSCIYYARKQGWHIDLDRASFCYLSKRHANLVLNWLQLVGIPTWCTRREGPFAPETVSHWVASAKAQAKRKRVRRAKGDKRVRLTSVQYGPLTLRLRVPLSVIIRQVGSQTVAVCPISGMVVAESDEKSALESFCNLFLRRWLINSLIPHKDLSHSEVMQRLYFNKYVVFNA